MRARLLIIVGLLAVTTGACACTPSPAAGPVAPSTTTVQTVPVTVEPAPSCFQLTGHEFVQWYADLVASGVTPTDVLGVWYVPAGTQVPDLHDNGNATVRVCIQVAS